MACEAGKGNGKRGKSEIRLLVSPTPRKKKKQVITEVKGNAPAAAPRRQDAALPRSLVFLWQLRSPVVISRAGKSQPELPFKNTVDRLHFRFTKPKKCGTLERDIQRNYKEEWSVTNWAF